MRHAVARRWAVLTLAVALLALLLAPLCIDGMSAGGMVTSRPAAGAATGDPPTATLMPPAPAECAALASEPVAACTGVASHTSASGLSAARAGQILLACIAVLIAVLVAVLGLRAPRGLLGVASPPDSRAAGMRLGLPAPRPELARLCVLRT